MAFAGPAFQEFVSLCYERCEQIVSLQLQARNANAAGQPSPEYNWQFVVCSLDLISGLADGIGPSLAAIVTKGQLNTLIPQCCKVVPQIADGRPTKGCAKLKVIACTTTLLAGINSSQPEDSNITPGDHDEAQLKTVSLKYTFVLISAETTLTPCYSAG